ncbi:MAG: hypothetical protein ACOZIN_12580 [Myxococcota bacterium]
MRRFALSLSLAVWLMAPTAQAEGTRSLGVTVSPVGAFAMGGGTEPVAGYSATLAWRFRSASSLASVGGHVASSLAFTEATPLSVQLMPFADRAVQPYLGLGASLMVSHPGEYVHALRESGGVLRVGAQLAAGVGVRLGPKLDLNAEGRYFNYPFAAELFAARRIQVTSAYLGLGFRL